MKRVLQYDQIDFTPAKITHRDDPILGSVTIFHDIVIAREIVQVYDDGRAYKPAQELEDAVWTAEGRWVIIGRHPETGIMSNRGDIGGRTVNVRSTKSLTDPKTERPNNRGILVDLEVFDSRVDPMVLSAMKTGIRSDVSIGFFFDQDATPGVIDDAKHPLNGIAYDYIQRNIMIDHTAAALETGTGRCPMPSCGIGADSFKRLVTGDPFGGFSSFADCVSKNKDKDDPEAYCASIENKIKGARKKKDAEEAFIPTEEDKLTMERLNEVETENTDLKTTIIEKDRKIYALYATIGKLKWKDEDPLPIEKEDELETDDLVEEEFQGNAENITESDRAKAFFNIGDKKWDALTENEKNDYISRLPPKKVRAGGEELSDRDSADEDCEDCGEEDDEHEHCPEGQTWSEEEKKCVSADAEEDEGLDEEEDSEQEPDEDAEIELPSTDQVVKDTEKVLADIVRLVG